MSYRLPNLAPHYQTRQYRDRSYGATVSYENGSRGRRPVLVTDGTSESEGIRQLLLVNTYASLDQVMEQEALPYSRPIMERVAKQHSTLLPHPIIRKT